MTKKEREKSIRKIVNLFRRAIGRLGRDFAASVDLATAVGLHSKIMEMNAMLAQIEEASAKWAIATLPRIYSRARSDVRKQMRAMSVAKPVGAEKAFRLINVQTVEALVNDPSVGFISSVNRATATIKRRMRTIRNQAKILQQHQKIFDETIAKVGLLEGKNINAVKNALVREMLSLKKSSELVWSPRVRRLGRDSILSNIANLPFVKVPDARAEKGHRLLRVDHYAETLARTKVMQAESLARRNEMLSFGHGLVQISKNKPLQDDACYMYIGRVFAITKDAADEWGITRTQELPNGGTPFHPNCTHTEIPYFPEYSSDEENNIAMMPPPKWALNKPFGAVQKEYRRRGGKDAIAKLSTTGSILGRETGGRLRRKMEEQRK